MKHRGMTFPAFMGRDKDQGIFFNTIINKDIQGCRLNKRKINREEEYALGIR